MSLSEEAKECLNNIPNDQKIDKMIENVENWDLQSLISWVQCEMEDKLLAATPEEVNQAYYLLFEEEIEEFIARAEDTLPPEPKVCVCPMTIGGIIHEADCPEQK